MFEYVSSHSCEGRVDTFESNSSPTPEALQTGLLLETQNEVYIVSLFELIIIGHYAMCTAGQ